MKELTSVQALEKARKLIQQSWTQEAFARGKSGKPVSCGGRAATTYCMVGAIWRVTRQRMNHATACLIAALPAPFATGSYESLAAFNDNSRTTKADVLACYDYAILLATQESEGDVEAAKLIANSI